MQCPPLDPAGGEHLTLWWWQLPPICHLDVGTAHSIRTYLYFVLQARDYMNTWQVACLSQVLILSGCHPKDGLKRNGGLRTSVVWPPPLLPERRKAPTPDTQSQQRPPEQRAKTKVGNDWLACFLLPKQSSGSPWDWLLNFLVLRTQHTGEIQSWFCPDCKPHSTDPGRGSMCALRVNIDK